jgi:HNH endonuclease
VEIASAPVLERQKLQCYNGGMPNELRQPTRLSNEQLLSEVRTLAGREREATARLIASLAELDARRLYLGEGYSSLFTYCTQCLHLSEHAAYGRIEAARVARRLPAILDLLADGSVTLTTVCLLAAHLTTENHRQLLGVARHKSKREVEQQVAALRPLPCVASVIRKLPAPKPSPGAPRRSESVSDNRPNVTAVPAANAPATVAQSAPRPAIIAPLAPERYKVQFTVPRETHDKLRRVQDLLRHSVPNGDPAVIFDRALTLLLAELEKKKLARTDRPRQVADPKSGSRHVPAAVKREVWKRDGGRCTFVGTGGRCSERGWLEFHHVIPFAEGGETTSANLQLRCRAHNAYEAETHFGPLLLREATVLYRFGPDRLHQIAVDERYVAETDLTRRWFYYPRPGPGADAERPRTDAAACRARLVRRDLGLA